MEIRRISIFTGQEHTMDLAVTEDQLNLISSGARIQNVLPHLTAEEREFLITGTTSEEWDKYLPQDEEY